MDETTEKAIKKAVEPIITSALSFALSGAATAVLTALLVTNYKKNTLTGDTEIAPTKKETVINSSETKASGTDASLNKDDVKAKDGELKATSMGARIQSFFSGIFKKKTQVVDSNTGVLETDSTVAKIE